MVTEQGVVLVRHRAGTAEYHLLPGGGVDYRETVGDALLREIREETGLTAKLGEPLIISDTIDPKGRRHVINIVFSATILGGDVLDSPEDPRVVGVDVVPVDQLQMLDLRPPMAAQLCELLEEGLDRARPRYLGSLFVEQK